MKNNNEPDYYPGTEEKSDQDSVEGGKDLASVSDRTLRAAETDGQPGLLPTLEDILRERQAAGAVTMVGEINITAAIESEPKVWDVTVRVCQACIDLKGQECHTPACVFCFHGMEEVKWLLDKMLICPIIDGERIILAGKGVDDDCAALECAMCGESNCFVISPLDPAVGYCFKEQQAWRIVTKPDTNTAASAGTAE